jgi:hypothetical protein
MTSYQRFTAVVVVVVVVVDLWQSLSEWRPLLSECVLVCRRKKVGASIRALSQWTETSVWFDNIGISAFHSCVVVDVWQSLSEWRLLLSERVLVCRSKKVGA